MNRPRTLAALMMVATLPTFAQAQSLKDVLDARSRTSPANPGSPLSDSWHMDDWSAYNRAGWRAINKGYYDTAEHEFLSAIKAAKRMGDDDIRLLARSYADYAWALQKQGRNAQAEPLLKWALLAREKSLDPNAPPIAQSLNQLATLYSDLGRYSEAEAVLHRVIDSQAKSSKKANPLEFARSQTLMGLLLAAQRRYAESEQYFSKAITLREKNQGSSHADTGDALSNLAWAYLEQGKEEEAKPLFERALRIVERTKGESDYSVAHVVDGLGQVLAKRGQADEAEANFLRAISIWERFPNEGISLLESLRHYADLLDEKGRTADLEKIKARMAPLRAKYTLAQATRPGRWYRFPDPAPPPLNSPTPPRIPG